MKKESERKRERKQSPRGDGGSSWMSGRAGWPWGKEGRGSSDPCGRGTDPGTEARRRGVPPKLRSAYGNHLRRPKARRRESTRTVERQRVREDLTRGSPCSWAAENSPPVRRSSCDARIGAHFRRRRCSSVLEGAQPKAGLDGVQKLGTGSGARHGAGLRLTRRRVRGVSYGGGGRAALVDPEERRLEDVGTARGFDTQRLLGKARLGRCSGGRSRERGDLIAELRRRRPSGDWPRRRGEAQGRHQRTQRGGQIRA
ncbi:hornerin-like [Iris pallida]|uniref:Hornerin-like n=1 Tax=Iris pallida TaxID=29817 RepID=A0AAX6F8R4_IRIPA|nr:hornerin-like [Iris pallida]